MSRQRVLRAAVLLVVADLSWLVVAACAPTGSPTTATNNGPCTLTLSGAVTAGLTCAAVIGAYSASNSTFGVAINGPTSPMSMVSIAVGWPGDGHTGTFTSNDMMVTGGAAVTGTQGYY